MTTRYVICALLGLVMTFNLFYVMQSLIDTGSEVLTEPPDIDLPVWIARTPDKTPPHVIEPPDPITPPAEPPIGFASSRGLSTVFPLAAQELLIDFGSRLKGDVTAA